MKKRIAVRLCAVIVVSMFAALILNYYLQVKSAKELMDTNAMLQIDQTVQILKNNDEDLERLRENLKEDYFIRAKAAAYIAQNNPEVIGDLEETRKVAALLQVDELHFFDTEGRLFAGTDPQYYDYTFNSGEQMRFFLPMLTDYNLQLCQDVMPNTAENKMMQYIAVWREDREGIVQIGMEPVRLLEAMEKNELSYIFSIMTAEKGITIFAADPDTGEILGATDPAITEMTTKEMGIPDRAMIRREEGFPVEIEIGGEKNYCVIRRLGNVAVGVSSTYGNLYHSIPENMRLVVFSLCLLSLVIIGLTMKMLDKFIIHGIHDIIGGMKKIAGGDLDERVNVTNTPEFAELSGSVNQMVESLLETTGTLSLVFQNVDIAVAVYKYNQDMKRVLATSRLGDILGLSEEETRAIAADHVVFEEKIRQIMSRPIEEETDVFLSHENGGRYVKLKSYRDGKNTLGIVVDVTEEIQEKKRLEYERDIDVLTGLCSRRAFTEAMEKLFGKPEQLKHAMMLMTDMDNLKMVNDNWGHEQGDRILRIAASILRECEAPQKVAARLSGDEFVLVIYGAESRQKLLEYLSRLYERMKATVVRMPDGTELPVSLSGGCVLYPEFSGGCSEMLRLADQTMYRVKKGERGHFKVYGSSGPESEEKNTQYREINGNEI